MHEDVQRADTMLAQLSERGELVQVFDDLFDHEGCSLELQPAARYGGHAAARFADIVATASAQGVTAIGYQLASITAGGPAPLVAALLYRQYGTSTAIAWYIAVCSVISLVCVGLLKDRSGRLDHE